ncbi:MULTISPECIES: DUF485 domain-containing protein [unclassified Kitasatospora]|uniref:DUF485 domain-containing protein n=1 Tax=unclassified Kitasatospora TaxID=2633591 RepID=UPI0033DAD109
MPQQQTSSPGQGERFDWWAAPAAPTLSATPSGSPADVPSGATSEPFEPSAPHRRSAVPTQPAPARPASAGTAPARTAPARAERSAPVAAEPVAAPADRAAVPPIRPDAPVVDAAPAAVPEAADSTEVYRAVQASAPFQDIRRSYRSFVFPVTGGFLGWYLLYVAAQAAAPDLMRTQVAGPFNVAWLLGLLQFASTFLLTWLYARNARTKRDRAALGLRWDTQDQLR